MSLARHLPRFRAARRAMDDVAAREQWTLRQIELHQLDRLNVTWGHAIRHVRHYRDLARERHLPSRFHSLADFQASLPLLEKRQVAQDPASFLSDAAAAGAWHRTSGSTGMPLRVYRAHADHRSVLRAKYRLYASWGADVFDRFAWLWGSHDDSAPGAGGWIGRSTQRWRDQLRNRLRLPAGRLGQDDLRSHLRQIRRFRPAAIYGFSRALHMLALEAEAQNFRCESLKFVCHTGEAATPEMRHAISRAFGVPVMTEYGCVECGLIAGEASDGTLRVREDVVFVETVPRGDGHHDIVISVLDSGSFPLLRYRIGDLTDAPLHRPDRGMAVLRSVLGRNDDMLRSGSGRSVHASCIDELFERWFAGVVGRYRVHQAADGSVDIRVVLQAGQDADLPGRLRAKVAGLLESDRVSVSVVSSISQTSVGKHRLITSDCRE